MKTHTHIGQCFSLIVYSKSQQFVVCKVVTSKFYQICHATPVYPFYFYLMFLLFFYLFSKNVNNYGFLDKITDAKELSATLLLKLIHLHANVDKFEWLNDRRCTCIFRELTSRELIGIFLWLSKRKTGDCSKTKRVTDSIRPRAVDPRQILFYYYYSDEVYIDLGRGRVSSPSNVLATSINKQWRISCRNGSSLITFSLDRQSKTCRLFARTFSQLLKPSFPLHENFLVSTTTNVP